MTAKTYYINEDANGCVCISKKPMSQRYYCTPVIIKCVETKSKRITRKGIFVGAICVTIENEILKIVGIKNRKGYERIYAQ